MLGSLLEHYLVILWYFNITFMTLFIAAVVKKIKFIKLWI